MYIQFTEQYTSIHTLYIHYIFLYVYIDQYKVALIQGSACGKTTIVNNSISFINVLTDTSYVFEGYTLDSTCVM